MGDLSFPADPDAHQNLARYGVFPDDVALVAQPVQFTLQEVGLNSFCRIEQAIFPRRIVVREFQPQQGCLDCTPGPAKSSCLLGSNLGIERAFGLGRLNTCEGTDCR